MRSIKAELPQAAPGLASGALIGAVTSLPVIGVGFLGEQLVGLPFLPFNLFDAMARVLPGAVVNFGIDTLVRLITFTRLGPTASTAKAAEQTLAIGQFVVLGAIFGLILAGLQRGNPSRSLARGAVAGLILMVVAFIVAASLGFPDSGPIATAVWFGALLAGWGLSIQGALQRSTTLIPPPTAAPAATGLSRRGFLLIMGGGALAVTAFTVGLGSLLRRRPPNSLPPQPIDTAGTSGPAASPPADALAARFPPAPGTRPEVTANGDFYRIDIDTLPPQVDASTWKLDVGGLVRNPLTLSLDDLRARPSTSQFVTMQCISNPIGGDLTSTSEWTGVPLRDILNEAGLSPEAHAIGIESVDGFYESVDLSDALDERTLLVYAMGGEPLAAEHGFPLRIYIPNRYGMKQPKWITHLQALNQPGPGYWVDRGWSARAIPQTVSVVDAANADPATQTVPVGGIAWAGARGISRVEVQVDGGPWVEARLRVPPLSPLTWVEWRYDWPYAAGRHTFSVRAYDGTGALQVTEAQDTFPDGATGIDSLTVTL
jgi:DMSO/TMAO reductase YedYZ molybdopterin-dependent catalytic subunit